MPSIISKYPLDLSGRSSTNLVPGEKQLLLARGITPYRVVSFTHGGFYTPSLKVYDKNFKLLKANVDYIATYKHIDASNYIGIEVCSAVVILNAALTDHVLLGGQLVGSDFAFSLTVEDDTIAYLDALGEGVVPVWAGLIGDEPQWQPGELQEERWARHHYGHMNAAIERLTAAITSGNGAAEDIERANIRQLYQLFIARFQGQIAAHINDQANPHEIDKHLVGLSLIENYTTADTVTAKAGTSSTHYLTTRGVFDMLNQFAGLPLQQHLDARYTTHTPTAVQLNTYLKAAFDDRVATKLPVNGTAVDANGIMGLTPSNPTILENLSLTPAYNEMRRALNASNFTVNRVSPARLGVGTPTADKFLLANGTWTSFSDLYLFFTAGGGAEIYWAGQQGNNSTALANIRTTFANEQAYPWGTVVIFMVSETEGVHYYGNGTSYDVNTPFRAAIRSQTDWFILG